MLTNAKKGTYLGKNGQKYANVIYEQSPTYNFWLLRWMGSVLGSSAESEVFHPKQAKSGEM